MRTNEERLAAMHRRAAELTKQKRMKQSLITGAAGIAGCVMMLILLVVRISGISTALQEDPAAGAMMSASIFAGNSSLSYIIVGIIAFLLGVSVTVFCFRLKKWQDSKSEKDRL